MPYRFAFQYINAGVGYLVSFWVSRSAEPYGKGVSDLKSAYPRLVLVVCWCLGVDAVEHAREGDGFAEVRDAADPGYEALDAHAEAGMGD